MDFAKIILRDHFFFLICNVLQLVTSRDESVLGENLF